MFTRLLDVLFPPRADERIVRTTSESELLSLLAPTLVPTTRPHTVSLLPFSNERVRALIHEAKYHGSVPAFTLLGAVLAEYLTERDTLQTIVVVPVPLAPKRLRTRGYNQTAEVVRRALLAIGDTLNEHLLTRTRETLSQVTLPRHLREANMRGAFTASQGVQPEYLYIVVDDVTTTGATMQAALDALTAAGARHLLPIALAH